MRPGDYLKDNWKNLLPWPAVILCVVLTAAQLHAQGRIWWCVCGQHNLWAGDIWSAHNSQHLADPYSFTHVLHGVIFYGLISWFLPRLSLQWRFFMTVFIESCWELLENSTLVIQRYREATMALGYEGDSITNSMADIVCCAIGFFLARRLGLRWSIVLFVITELVLLAWMRDNLTLNVLMLLCPVDAIKAWQVIH